MDIYTAFILLLLILFFMLLIGVPIGLGLGTTAIIGILLFLEPRHLVQTTLLVYKYSTSEGLLIVPMFILMAEVIRLSELAEGLFDAVYKWTNWLPGSLASTSIMASAQFAAISGSSTATVATIGIVSIPEMLKRDYARGLACGAVAAGGVLGILIPPSLAMVIYGIVTQTSITKLFIAGVVPGIFVTGLLVLYITLRVKLNPKLAPRSESFSMTEKVHSLPGIIPLLILAIVVLGSLYTGVTTVTEAAGLGVVGAFILSLFSGNFTLKKFGKALVNSTRTTGMIFMIVFGGMLFAFLMSSLEIPQGLSRDIVALSENRWFILIAINIILLVLGCFLDAIAIIVITVPFLGPIIEGLGFDLIWFGVMITINAEIGLITPPVGLNLFILRGITPPEIKWKDIILGSLPFTLMLMAGIALIIIFPDIALWLPSRMK